MTREEFGETLHKIRRESPATIATMCRALQDDGVIMKRIEKARHSYAIINAINYLKATGHKLIAIKCDEQKHHLADNSSAATLLLNTRGKESAVKVAEAIGVTTKGLRCMERQITSCSIDMFLKLCDYYGITITFEPIDNK